MGGRWHGLPCASMWGGCGVRGRGVDVIGVEGEKDAPPRSPRWEADTRGPEQTQVRPPAYKHPRGASGT